MQVAAFLATSFLVSLVLTRVLASPRAFIKIIDMPNPRSLHARATPRTGGVAILTALLFTTASLLLAARSGAIGGLAREAALDIRHRDLLVTLVALTVLAGVSLWDDRHHVSPIPRLITHALAAAAVMWAGDLTITGFSLPFFGVVTLGHSSYAFTFLFIVWMTNLYNFMDGADGLAGGMTLLGFSFLGAGAWMSGDEALAIDCAIVAAAGGAFLLFNFPPARLFMGDAGSIPLGFLAAAFALAGWRDGDWPSWFPAVVFAPFITDATLTLVKRLASRERIWEAHNHHYYQRLVRMGWGHRKTALAEYALMLGCGTTALWALREPLYLQLCALLALVALHALLALRVDSAWRHRPNKPIESA